MSTLPAFHQSLPPHECQLLCARDVRAHRCNYPGSQAALNGCINDVIGMQSLLTTYLGFSDSDITVLIDTDAKGEQPNSKNIKVCTAGIEQQGRYLLSHVIKVVLL